jgi:archaellum component FlaF (FlaF/FlaG flagellin family)
VLAGSPGARAWARVVSSELAPLAGENPMTEIPAEGSSASDRGDGEPTSEPAAPSGAEPVPAPNAAASEPEATDEAGTGGAKKRSSRLGGAVVILVAVLVVAAVLFFALRGGNSNKHTAANSTTATSTPAASATTASTPSSSSTTSSGTSAKVVAQINLSPPTTAKASKAAGIAEVLNEGSTDGVAIVAQNVPANSTKPPNAYAVWLYNSPKDAKILGFVNPGVGKTGRLSTAGALPTNASHYKQLIVTVETTASPKAPGTIVLQGTLTNLK